MHRRGGDGVRSGVVDASSAAVVSSFRLVVSHILPHVHRTVVLGVYVVLLFFTSPGPGAEGASCFLFFLSFAACLPLFLCAAFVAAFSRA